MKVKPNTINKIGFSRGGADMGIKTKHVELLKELVRVCNNNGIGILHSTTVIDGDIFYIADASVVVFGDYISVENMRIFLEYFKRSFP